MNQHNESAKRGVRTNPTNPRRSAPATGVMLLFSNGHSNKLATEPTWLVIVGEARLISQQAYRLPQTQSDDAVSYTHLRAHETLRYLVCRLLLEKKK